MVLEFDDGATEAYDRFGHRPWEPGYASDAISSAHDYQQRLVTVLRLVIQETVQPEVRATRAIDAHCLQRTHVGGRHARP